MNSKFVRQNIFPVLAAFIWGTAFVAQSVAADLVQPFTFNASRAFVGFLFLLVLCMIKNELYISDIHFYVATEQKMCYSDIS